MMKSTNEMAFLYNFNDPERLRKVRNVLLCMKARSKVVTEEQFQQPVGMLAGMVDISFNEPEDTSSFTDEMLVISGFYSKRINDLMVRLRKAGVGDIKYKAALTPTNMHWTGVQLYRELAKEREAIEKGQAAHHEEVPAEAAGSAEE